MTAHLRKWLTDIGDMFWLLPGLMVLAGILLAFDQVIAAITRGVSNRGRLRDE